MISFRSLTENDLPLLHSWFQKPHVKQWYARGEDYSLNRIQEKYGSRIGDPKIPNFIIDVDNIPIGYIQRYCVQDSLPDGVESYDHDLFSHIKAADIAGIDLFIADENYLGKGYATAALEQFIKEHIAGMFTVIIADPLKINVKVIRFFERNGFKKFDKNTDNSMYELMLLSICGKIIMRERL